MADLSSVRDGIIERAGRIRDAALDEVLAETIAAAPQDTGYLKETIHAEATETSESAVAGVIVCDADYAEWTDTGSSAHVIEPVNASVLVFPVNGAEVFTMHVDHPGSPGTGWFAEAMAERWHTALENAASGG